MIRHSRRSKLAADFVSRTRKPFSGCYKADFPSASRKTPRASICRRAEPVGSGTPSLTSLHRVTFRRWPTRFLSCAILLTMVATHVCEALDRMVEIPAGDLAHSLEQLSRQLDIQILYDADRLKGLKSPAIQGFLTAQEALDQLLNGTSLAFQGRGDGFVVTPKSSPPSTAIPAAADQARPPINPELAELTVTGTHIRGEIPVGA